MGVTEDKDYEADTSFSTMKNKRPVVDTNEEVRLNIMNYSIYEPILSLLKTLN